MYLNRANKGQAVLRAALLILVTAVVLPAFSLAAAAEEKGNVKVSVSAERYCTDEIAAEQAYINNNSDGTVTFFPYGETPRVFMSVTPMKAETEANALRVVINNDSDFDLMRLDFVYKNSAHLSENGSESISISTERGNEEYIVPIPAVDRMTKLELSFIGGNGTGSVTLVSIGAVSYYHDDRVYFGELLENTYDRAGQTAEFAGTVAYETVLQYPDANIVLYRLGQDEVIEDIRFAHPYVKSTPMSLDFKFVFPIESTSDSCSRYFAAVLTSDNKVIPLTAETYLKEKDVRADGGSDSAVNNEIFKGIETNLYEGASENGTSVAFVDVRLDKMFSDSGDGYQYILDEGKEYYFDRAYISALDDEISNYSSVGVAVYLRFLVDTYSYQFGHLDRISVPGKAKYFAIKPQDDETVNNVFACTDFIVSRYSAEEYGTLRGVVLGRSLDKAFEYNHCGTASMSKYADMLARAYSVIRIAMDRSSSELEVILPLSDAVIGPEVVMSLENREKNYPSDLLADVVLSILERYGTDISSLYFMLESDLSSVQLDGGDSASSESGMGVGSGEYFIEEIKKLSEKHQDLPDELFCCWFPGEA
jgi:hypothetical protein